MEEKLKEIVATFIRVPAEQIGPATPIDRQAVKSSIMLHRMYAKLAEAGFVVTDYAAIKIFGDLPHARPGGNGHAAPATSSADPAQPADGSPAKTRIPATAFNGPQQADPTGEAEPLSMGIDIESIASLPKVADFRREEFYKQNFTPQEMAWCILQPEPYESFAGLFAVKEALIKADNSLMEKSFNQISIGRSTQGRPLYPGFTISIAHSNGTAVAVAARATNGTTPPALTLPTATTKTNAGRTIAWLALLLAAAALILSLLHAK